MKTYSLKPHDRLIVVCMNSGEVILTSDIHRVCSIQNGAFSVAHLFDENHNYLFTVHSEEIPADISLATIYAFGEVNHDQNLLRI